MYVGYPLADPHLYTASPLPSVSLFACSILGFLTPLSGSRHPRRPLPHHPPHRRPRARRILRKHDPHLDQHPRDIAARCAAAGGGGVLGSVRVGEAAEEQGDRLLLQGRGEEQRGGTAGQAGWVRECWGVQGVVARLGEEGWAWDEEPAVSWG